MVWTKEQVARERECAEMEMLDGTLSLCASHEALRADRDRLLGWLTRILDEARSERDTGPLVDVIVDVGEEGAWGLLDGGPIIGE